MFTNTIEMRVYGLMRSGNHAIIEWIKRQYPERTICFLNNIKHGDFDPYQNYIQKELIEIDEQLDIESLRKTKKYLLIYSYEDRQILQVQNIDFLSSIFQFGFEEKREVYFGKSKYHFDVAIIRDPFNCFASRLTMLQQKGAMEGVDDMEVVVHNWKILAKHAIALKDSAKPEQIVINYNFWTVDKSYRERISQQLMGTFNDESIDSISSFGGGSSFNAQSTNRITIRDLFLKWRKIFNIRRFMKIRYYIRRLFALGLDRNVFFKRWKKLSDNEEYRKLFVDREILDLSEKIFGEIPGTRAFIASINK